MKTDPQDSLILLMVFIAVLVMGLASTIKAFQALVCVRGKVGEAGARRHSALNSPQIIEEFQRRRRIHTRSLLVMPVVFGYLFGITALFRRLGSAFLGLPLEAHLVAGFAVIAGAVYIGTSTYRCPACDQRPWGNRYGVMVYPSRCPNCGVVLK